MQHLLLPAWGVWMRLIEASLPLSSTPTQAHALSVEGVGVPVHQLLPGERGCAHAFEGRWSMVVDTASLGLRVYADIKERFHHQRGDGSLRKYRIPVWA